MTLIFEEHPRLRHSWALPERKDDRTNRKYWVKYHFIYETRPPSLKDAYPSLDVLEDAFEEALREEFDSKATHPDKGVQYDVASTFYANGAVALRAEVVVNYAKPGKMPRVIPAGMILRLGVQIDQKVEKVWKTYSEVRHAIRRFERKVKRLSRIEDITLNLIDDCLEESPEEMNPAPERPLRPHHLIRGWRTKGSLLTQACWEQDTGEWRPRRRRISVSAQNKLHTPKRHLLTPNGTKILAVVNVQPGYGQVQLGDLEEDLEHRVKPALKKAHRMRDVFKDIFEEYSIGEVRSFLATKQMRYYALNRSEG